MHPETLIYLFTIVKQTIQLIYKPLLNQNF